MKTSEEIEKDFRKDFQDLLDRYGAEISLEDDGGYVSTPYVGVYVHSAYDEDSGQISEYTSFRIL